MLNILKRIKTLEKEGILFDKIVERISGPVQLIPKQETENYTTSHLNKSDDYHQIFSDYEGIRIMWELEQSVIKSIIENHVFTSYLDFAGGTGRIASIIENKCNQSYILDISERMLSVAERKLKNTQIICGDFNDKSLNLKCLKFDLITAFRFFPNAEANLRFLAMQFISNKLNNGGLLICNNHRNFWSIPYFFMRLTFFGGHAGMSSHQMITLSEQCGLELIGTYSMGVVPQTNKKTILFSWKLTKYIETFIFNHIGTRHSLGYNVIYVFRKI